jgi:hypothetical protein
LEKAGGNYYAIVQNLEIKTKPKTIIIKPSNRILENLMIKNQADLNSNHFGSRIDNKNGNRRKNASESPLANRKHSQNHNTSIIIYHQYLGLKILFRFQLDDSTTNRHR